MLGKHLCTNVSQGMGTVSQYLNGYVSPNGVVILGLLISNGIFIFSIENAEYQQAVLNDDSYRICQAKYVC